MQKKSIMFKLKRESFRILAQIDRFIKYHLLLNNGVFGACGGFILSFVKIDSNHLALNNTDMGGGGGILADIR